MDHSIDVGATASNNIEAIKEALTLNTHLVHYEVSFLFLRKVFTVQVSHDTFQCTREYKWQRLNLITELQSLKF